MSLQQKLNAYKKQFLANAPPEKAALMAQATEELIASGILEKTLKEGEVAPDFSLQDADGSTVRLATLLKEGPVVLTFYRGLW